jgi:hypothetical protein
MEDKRGMCIASISKDITRQNIRTLNTSLEELISVNPWEIILNFGDIDFLDKDVLEDITSIMVNFTKLYKTVSIVASNESFAGLLKRKNVAAFNTVYKSISEIPGVPAPDR